MTYMNDYWWIYWRPDQIYWCRYETDKITARPEGLCADWDELPVPAGSQVVLCVPGEYVRIHKVTVPSRNRRRFMAGIPFALEEGLLKAPECYHYVLLPDAGSRSEALVAVVEHRLMELWLEAAGQHGWDLRMVYPEYMALSPPAEGVWLLDVTTSPMLIRMGESTGAVVPGITGDRPPGTLLLALEKSTQRPQKLCVRVANGDQSTRVRCWENPLSQLGLELELIEDERQRRSYLAQQPLPDGRYNLLREHYAPRNEIRNWIRRLRPSLAIAAMLIVALIIQWGVEGMHIRKEHQYVLGEIESTYLEAFPGAKNLVDPRYQMEKALEDLRKGRTPRAADIDLLVWLTEMAPVLNNTSGSNLDTLSFDGTTLTLEISVPDYETLSTLQKQLQNSSAISVEDAQLRDGRVHGRLRMEIPG